MIHTILPGKYNLFLHICGIAMLNHKAKAGMHEIPALLSEDIKVELELATQ